MHSDLGVSQELRLAPQLLQWLRILQVSTTDLSALVQTELDSNPTLEVDAPEHDDQAEIPPERDTPPAEREFDPGLDGLGEKLEYLADIDQEWREEGSAGCGSAQASDTSDAQELNDNMFNSVTQSKSLQEHLSAQFCLLDDPGFNEKLGGLIVGSLDDRGYLIGSVDELATLAGTTISCVERALSVVQSLDPAGVGARDLRECLLLQLRAPDADPLARRLVSEHLQAIAQKQFADLAALLQVDEQAVLRAVQVIRSLDPAPGQRFLDHRVEHVEADVIVSRHNGAYVVEPTDERVPRLRLSASCQRMLKQENLGSEEVAYIRRKMRAAMFMIQGISQRQETLKKTVEQIARLQSGFLDRTADQPDALTMATVARLVGVHETTVSRAIANKYVKTPRGLFPLRHFFRTGIRCSDGSRMTPQQVMEFMAEAMRQEDARSPLLDRDIVKELGKRGLHIARRTVAKYREELGIPASKERKCAGQRSGAAAAKPAETEQAAESAACRAA
jgi:RNA polymerase sigma-54 factor